MKLNLETRNIFTHRGRLNRRIDKHNKLIKKINELSEALAMFDKDIDSEECVIRCDNCSHEFNISDENIESIHTDENDQPLTDIMFICPKCGFKNSIDEDEFDECDDFSDEEENFIEETTLNNEMDVDREAELEKCSNNEKCDCKTDEEIIDKYDDFYDDESSTKEKIIKKRTKEVNIKNPKNKSHVVIINKSKSIDFINNHKIIDAINAAIEHKSTSETIDILSNKGINMITASDNNIIGYSTKTGDINFACDIDNKESISIFTVITKLVIVPHGKYDYVYNSILSQLNIEKVDTKYESMDLPGKACLVKLNDGSLAAINFSIDQNNITISIIYDIDKD